MTINGKKIEIGDKLRWFNAPVRHVRGFVDDMVIMRVWNRYKGRWDYDIQGPEFFFIFEDEITINTRFDQHSRWRERKRALEEASL